MSAWSFWSGCAEPCQPSTRVRVRHVKQQPSSSGEPCPRLEQRSGCREYRDHQGKHCGQKSGTAKHMNRPGFCYICNCMLLILYLARSVFDKRAESEFNRNGFSLQVLRSSPAWSLAKGGLSMTTMGTLWTLGRFHIHKASLRMLKLHMTSGIKS